MTGHSRHNILAFKKRLDSQTSGYWHGIGHAAAMAVAVISNPCAHPALFSTAGCCWYLQLEALFEHEDHAVLPQDFV